MMDLVFIGIVCVYLDKSDSWALHIMDRDVSLSAHISHISHLFFLYSFSFLVVFVLSGLVSFPSSPPIS